MIAASPSLEIDNTNLNEGRNVTQNIACDTNTDDTTIEVEYNPIHCQKENNNESRCNTKAILLITRNDDFNENNTYNEITILDEEKRINQSLTNAENHTDVKTAHQHNHLRS